MKVKATKSSRNDGDKFTFRVNAFYAKGILKDGDIVLLTLKGINGRPVYVVLTVSRNGTTLYGECPRNLRLPHVGKFGSKYYEVLDYRMVEYV